MDQEVLFDAHLTPLIGDLSNKKSNKTKACAEKCTVIPLNPRGYEVAKSGSAKQAKSLKLLLTGHVARRQCEEAEFYIWDTELPGFGLRFRSSGGKRWFLRYKERGRARVWTIGKVTDISAEHAREAARKRLREVALLGLPKKPAPVKADVKVSTFADLVEHFLADRPFAWKPSTEYSNKRALKGVLLPYFGSMAVDAIRKQDVLRWRDTRAERSGAFNREIAVLSGVMQYAEQLGLRKRGSNPARGTPRFKREEIQRFLEPAEYRRLHLRLSENDNVMMVAAMRLLLHTGARCGEISNLRWGEVSRERLELADSKTGPKSILLSRQARAILDGLPRGDELALEELAIWALRHYSPIVATDPPDGLVLDIHGAAHLYGGEAGLISDVITRLADLGITAYAALADTWGAAHALARFGRQTTRIVEPGGHADALLKLPIAALRLPAEMMPDLLLLGLDTIGELAAKPRAPLTQSFGPKLFRCVDQAFGRLAEPIEPVESPELISVQRIFAEPIGAPETLEKYTRRLTDAICDRMEEAGLGSRRLDLHFTRVDNRIETIFVATAKPVRDPKRLGRLLCDKIETVDPGWGVDKMTLTAAYVEPLVPKQVVAQYSAPPRPDVEELWDTITNRYGRESLYRAVSVATDIPERAVKRASPTSTEVGSRRNAGYRRPQRIYRQPEPILALAALPDHPPRAFTWRGQRYSVLCADGPERVRGEWWRSDNEKGKVRDYFILEVDNGERFWAFRAGDGQHEGTGSLNWYLHGKFD